MEEETGAQGTTRALSQDCTCSRAKLRESVRGICINLELERISAMPPFQGGFAVCELGAGGLRVRASEIRIDRDRQRERREREGETERKGSLALLKKEGSVVLR